MRREAGSPAGRPGARRAMNRDRGAGGTLEGHWENPGGSWRVTGRKLNVTVKALRSFSRDFLRKVTGNFAFARVELEV